MRKISIHSFLTVRLNEGKLMQICEFQEMMRHLYFQRDYARGTDGTFQWLEEEIAELGEAMQCNDKTALEKEFADVLAWLASLANVTSINLEKAALDKYDNKCPKCGFAPCNCVF
jgi:NTP pyrophosphatase (non-canonical NTP hydrolase)